MKRTALVGMIALSVALSACASGTDIGKGLTDPGTSISSPSPSLSLELPKKKKAGKKKDEPKKVEEPKGNTIIIAVRDNNEGYEYKLPGKDWIGAHSGGPPAYVGDTIIFKNQDIRNNKHSWTNAAGSGVREGKFFDSGWLEVGEQFTWKVPNKPGRYEYFDDAVPYRAAGTAGPLVICSSPACPEASA